MTVPATAMSFSGLAGIADAGVSSVEAWLAKADAVPSIPLRFAGARWLANARKLVPVISAWFEVVSLTNWSV